MIGHLLLPGFSWGGWSFDPTIVGTLFLAGWLYARGLRALWRGGAVRGVGGFQAASFAGGLVAVAAALVSPIDRLAADLLWAHMLQHLLLIVVAAPLLVLGAPLIPFLLALPLGWRLRFRRLTRHRAVRSAGRWLGAPVLIWLLHVTVLWAWHAPGPYQAAVRSPWLHALEHLSFLGTAVAFWWVLLPQTGRGRLVPGADVLYLFLAGLQGGALGALFTFASAPLYPIYGARAAAHGLAPLTDQQLAGLIMWIPAGLIYLGAASALFVRWVGTMERGLAGRGVEPT